MTLPHFAILVLATIGALSTVAATLKLWPSVPLSISILALCFASIILIVVLAAC